MLEHVHHRVPVTALAFYGDNVILAGEGNLLRAYDVTTHEVLASLPAFDNQSIHGILVKPDQQQVLVWGGNFIRSFRSEAVNFLAGSVRRATDWILDAALSPDNELVAIIMAHNALAGVHLTELSDDGPQSGHNAIQSVVPGSNCILYSAHVTWLSASHCLIASGTAFGDIIVWSAAISTQDGTFHAQAQTHYTFSAHEGSVFGVQLSSQVQVVGMDDCKGLLASCSDDRTIRVWDVSNLSADGPTLTQLQRDTGFGAKDKNECAPRCLAKAMGHVSRIWQVRFLQHPAAAGELSDGLRIISFGEDASNITWSIERAISSAADTLPFSLQQVGIEIAHFGKHIWSVAMSHNARFATGGADGAIAIHSLAPRREETEEISRELLGEDAADSFRAYSFINHNTLVSTTHNGKIGLVTLGPSARTAAVTPAFSSLRGYSVAAGTSIDRVAILAGEGVVYAYLSNSCVFEALDTGKKVAGLWAHTEDQAQTWQETRRRLVTHVSILVTPVNARSATLLTLELDLRASTIQVKSRCELELPQCFVVTAFTLSRYEDDENHCALLGARNGSVAIYDLTSEASQAATLGSSVHLKVHGTEAVTSFHWTRHGETSQSQGLLHSIGRDGTHAIHRLQRINGTWRAELVHQLSLPFGPNLEGLGRGRPDHHLWVWGFKSKYFVVYDITAQRQIQSVDCGGAHRNWAFQPLLEGGTLVWTKASKLYRHTQLLLPYELINPGGHGREIKAVAVSPGQPQIIATGAEDTDIKLYTFDEQHGFRCLWTLRKHNTGIQHLQWSSDGSYLFSSAGFEEFYIWRIFRLPSAGVGVVCESIHPNSGKSDLRIMGFEIVDSGITSHKDPADLEINMVYSDSTVKHWLYSNRGWALSATGNYLTACLTEAFYLGTTLFTTATDGHLAIWDDLSGSETLTWSARGKVHQNAILVAKTCKLSDGSNLIVTGGDDNAIGITLVSPDHGTRTLLLPRAHAAAVTGVVIVSQTADHLVLATASIDQRLQLWQVDVVVERPGVDGISLRRLQNVPTAVADVSGLELLALEDGAIGVLVCGVGMDMWRVTMSTKSESFDLMTTWSPKAADRSHKDLTASTPDRRFGLLKNSVV